MQSDYEHLVKCSEYEERTPKEKWESLGWSWHEAGVPVHVLRRLVERGLIEVSYKSANFTCFKLTERGRRITSRTEVDTEVPALHLPDTLFHPIVGHEDLKELLRAVLALDKPIHVLLHGPPAIAKTMFLWEIERVAGEQALWLLGSASSKAGMWDLLAERRPRYLLVDEIEKMGETDRAGLLSLMEGGRIVRAKVGRRLSEKLDIRVIAAANRIHGLSSELLSRFAVKQLGVYDKVTFQHVVQSVLVMHEGVQEEEALEIASLLVGKTQDVRDAIRVARLSTRVGVPRAVELLASGMTT